MGKFKRWTVALIAVAILYLALPVVASAAGDTIDTATSISLDSIYNGTISSTNTSDFYKFTLPTSGKIQLSASAYMHWIRYRIYDANGKQLWDALPAWDSNTGKSSKSYDFNLTSGTYYFAAIKDGTSTGDYNFSISFTSANETFKEGNGGSDNFMETANAIGFNTAYYGQIATNDSKDFYTFTLSTSGKIYLTASAYIPHIYYRLYDANGNQLWSLCPYWDTSTGKSTKDAYLDLTSGTYYLAMTQYNNETGNYNFMLSFTSAGESFKEGNGGNNNSMETANTIKLNTSYNGQIAINDSKDYYRFTVSAAGDIHLTATAYMKYIYYKIYDIEGRQVWTSNPYWNTSTGKSTKDENITLTAGTYYFAVIQDGSNVGNYSFKLSYEIETPVLSAVSNTATGVKISWNPVLGAAKYRVFYKVSGGSWTKIADTTSTSYTWTGAKSGTKYAFTVRCISSDGASYTSEYDTTGLSITYLAVPQITSVTSSGTSVTVTWGKVAGAEKYRVFYKKNGSWTKLKDTTGTSVTITGGTMGKTYTYTVRCINSAGTAYTSAYDTTGKSITLKQLATPKISSVTGSGSSITIKWSAVSGAAKYCVFYKTGNNGWKKIADTTATSYTWTAAAAGTTYTFTVRCVSSDGSAFTSAYDTTGKSYTVPSGQLATPKISSISGSAGQVTVKWGAVSGAAKYRVFYKNGSSWKKIADTTSTSYTWTGAKAGTKYTFTVRCVSSDGSAFTSAYDTTGKSYTVPSNGQLATPKISTITGSAGNVKISWGAVSGAAKYRVFYKTSSGWKKIADTTSTSYTWTGAVYGTYTVTVRCVSADGNTFTSNYDPNGVTFTLK